MNSDKKYQLKKNIEEMIELNEMINSCYERLSTFRKKKNQLEEETTQLLDDLNIGNTTFKLNNYKIQQKKTNTYQSLSMKHIQKSLETYFPEDKINEILTLIKDNRVVKERYEFKFEEINK